MQFLLGVARLIDWFNEKVSLIAVWLVLASCLVSAANAGLRYVISQSSNAWLEMQWYMFAGIVMLGAAFVYKVNEHVRVDVVYGRLASRRRAWIDLLGTIFFLLPVAFVLTWLSWPFFVDAWVTDEMSSNAGGLARWPAKLAIPLGFALLLLQGVSEIIKRIGYLRGEFEMETHYERPLQ